MLKFLVAILLLGVTIYLVVRLLERRPRRGGGGSGGLGPRLRPSTPPRGPIGPDDDPEFLRDLNRRRPRPKRPGPDGPVDS